MKLPDYEKFLGPQQFGGHEGTTPERVLDVPAYGKACYLAGLEEAAKLLDELHAKDTLTNYHGFAANKVRALKGEIDA